MGENGNGSLTTKERLARIEALLEKVHEKLDGKADESDVVKLVDRVNALEVGRAKLVGIAVGFAIATGGTGFALGRALIGVG